MANRSIVEAYTLGLFDAGELERCAGDEWGITWVGDGPVRRIGYATNLSVEVAQEAVAKAVDLVLTHHDAWPFVFGMSERCAELLHPHGISHCFFHAPLDGADFGTSASLAEALGLRVTARCLPYLDVFMCGRIGEPEEPIDVEALATRLEVALGEPVRAWRHNDAPVRKVCVTAGGGHLTDLIREAVELGCDTYVTGEKSLYAVEYARFAGINLLVGSHTFTELPGVEAMARRVACGCGAEAVRLVEPRIE